MKNYVATFYSHFGALTFFKYLEKSGIKGTLAPVPRKLSSACGTCVLFSAEAPEGFQGEEIEAIYLHENDLYTCVLEF